MNGRLFKLVLNSSDPTGTRNAVDPARGQLRRQRLQQRGLAAPAGQRRDDDSRRSTSRRIPGGHNTQPTFAGATNARVWKYDLADARARRSSAEVDQLTALSGITNKGAWESSGIVDVSRIFGPGSFLIDVQAHGWDMDAGTGNDAPAVPKRERGQLLLLKVRGETAAASTNNGKGKGKKK